MKTSSLGVGGIFCIIAGTHALAQQEPLTLDEIIVTAEKSGEKSVMDTAFSIGAISGDSLEELGVTSVESALALVPGVTSTSFSGTTTTVQIRGVSPGLSGDATVGFYLDDLPWSFTGFPFSPNLNPYDLDRLEVLRGPQGTLYGASSTGGTIRVLTQDPVHDEFSGKLNAGLSVTDGSDGTNWKTQAAVNIPILEDKLSARLVASKLENRGYIDLPLSGEEDHNDSTSETYRLKVKFTPTDRLSIGFMGWFSEDESGAIHGEDDYTWSPQFVVLDAATGGVSTTIPMNSNDTTNSTDFDLYNLTVEYDFGNLDFYGSLSTMEYNFNYRQSFVSGFRNDAPTTSNVDNVELRLSYADDGPLSWTGGVFFLDNETAQAASFGAFLDLDPGPGVTLFEPTFENGALSLLSDRVQGTEQWAIFGEATYDFTDTLSVTTGLRYFEDTRSEVESAPALVAALDSFGIENGIYEENQSKVTGRFNVSYRPDADQLYYFNFAQGFRSGLSQRAPGYVTILSENLDFDAFASPETVDSFEIGFKNTYADGRVTVEGALYALTWDDIILQLTVPSAGAAGFASVFDNAGSAEAYGVDLSVAARLSEELTVQFSGNLNSSEYTDDNPFANIASGDEIGNTPASSFAVSANYVRPITEALSGRMIANYTYTDGKTERSSLNGIPVQSETDAMSFLSLRLGVEAEGWSVFLTGENLLNEDDRFSDFALYDALGTPPGRVRPRTVGLELNADF